MLCCTQHLSAECVYLAEKNVNHTNSGLLLLRKVDQVTNAVAIVAFTF